MKGRDLRLRRVSAGIPGRLVCIQSRIDRSRLSNIEREYVNASEEESVRIVQAIEELSAAKRRLTAIAAECGWPVSAL